MQHSTYEHIFYEQRLDYESILSRSGRATAVCMAERDRSNLGNAETVESRMPVRRKKVSSSKLE
jgi:hypothetical protein